MLYKKSNKYFKKEYIQETKKKINGVGLAKNQIIREKFLEIRSEL